METAEQPAKKPRINPDIWFYVFLAVVLGAIYFVLKREYKTELAAKDAQITSLQSDTVKLTKRVIEGEGRFDRLIAQKATEQAAYQKALTSLESDKRKIIQWAQSLSTERQIGAIAKALPVDLQADSARIQKAYTASDKELIRQLYQVVEERELFRAKLDTATRQLSVVETENTRLRSRELAYRRTLTSVQQSLLTEAETKRFLGIGRQKAMKQLAQSVGDQMSDLESELNRTYR